MEISGNIAWVFLGLVWTLIICPLGIKLFFLGRGTDRRRLQVLGTALTMFCLVVIWWVAVGYSWVFSDINEGFGWPFSKAFFLSIGISQKHGEIPEILFAGVIMMKVIVVVMMLGINLAHRMPILNWVLFVFLWLSMVLVPIARLIWNSPFSNFSLYDFSGGFLWLAAGISTLVVVIVTGGSAIRYSEQGYRLRTFLLGFAFIWLGLMILHALGSLKADASAVHAFMTTNFCACVGGLSWLIPEALKNGKASFEGIGNGFMAALISISFGAGYLTFEGALLCGLFSGLLSQYLIVYWAKALESEFSYYPFLLIVPPALVGALVTACFASPILGERSGFMYGSSELLISQIIGIVSVLSYSAILTLVLCLMVFPKARSPFLSLIMDR
ncbi:hypothetical protein [Persicobacter diffluens]|uniref:Ammonia channel protein n=1 Tax=Persicobacter diffluens TaxID=981 RepID=A0AAN4W0Q1_9BACT|nr:ammonia channel protein [Persicobacter diffluens]